MDENIILLGPCGVGKSTIGKALANQADIPFVDLDDERGRLYGETDFSEQKATEAMEKSVMDWYKYQKKYEFYSVGRILQENQKAVISFGGGQSVYDGTTYEKDFLEQMEMCRYVFLLLPCADEADSLAFLDQRVENEGERLLNRTFVSSKTNRAAATDIIYVAGKSVHEIVAEISEKSCLTEIPKGFISKTM